LPITAEQSDMSFVTTISPSVQHYQNSTTQKTVESSHLVINGESW
jgi:hypothetical protein